ncbi:MAG: 4a-hydroxytetrahydrobiopterin dehydratase [Fimbriimonadaceae bacterium]|nr:4a-hydroxytetrahydrobiopterin dehydratase [Alphaproteobacteria bacterium]
MPELLTGEARATALADLSGWSQVRDGGAIAKTFEFRNFSEAFAWMTRVAMAAEKLDHHPEWSNVYRTVEVTLSTHDAGGLTMRDITLARHMDKFANG